MVVDLDDLPDPEDVVATAELYMHTAAFRSWTARATKALTSHTRENGPVETPTGTLGRVWTGWMYPPSIADEMPQLGSNVISFSLGCEHDQHRPLEVLIEAMPELETEIRRKWKVTTEVDGKAAHAAAEGDGMMSERVRALRQNRTGLGRVQ